MNTNASTNPIFHSYQHNSTALHQQLACWLSTSKECPNDCPPQGNQQEDWIHNDDATNARRVCPPENQQEDRARGVHAELQGNPPEGNTNGSIEHTEYENNHSQREAGIWLHVEEDRGYTKQASPSTYTNVIVTTALISQRRDMLPLENTSDDHKNLMAMQNVVSMLDWRTKRTWRVVPRTKTRRRNRFQQLEFINHCSFSFCCITDS